MKVSHLARRGLAATALPFVLLLACYRVLPAAPAAAPPPAGTAIPPTATPAELPGREAPLITPTYCSSDRPTFWPTGMPPPTRRPAAVKRAIPTDKETCLQMGGFWDIPFCSGRVRPTNIPQPERSCWEVPTTDACQPCSDDSECEGWCTVPTGGQGSPMTGVCSPIAHEWQWTRFSIWHGQVVEQVRKCE
jgi:hypothetical protein